MKNCCIDGAAASLTSKLNMSRVCSAVNDQKCGVEAVISHDPGRCDNYIGIHFEFSLHLVGMW